MGVDGSRFVGGDPVEFATYLVGVVPIVAWFLAVFVAVRALNFNLLVGNNWVVWIAVYVFFFEGAPYTLKLLFLLLSFTEGGIWVPFSKGILFVKSACIADGPSRS